MQSDGGLTPTDRFIGSHAILSGPAGGVVGYAMTTKEGEDEEMEPMVGFDMGGTSTDVSRYSGEYEHVFETITAGVTIQAPQVSYILGIPSHSHLPLFSHILLSHLLLSLISIRSLLVAVLDCSSGLGCLWWVQSLLELTLDQPAMGKVRVCVCGGKLIHQNDGCLRALCVGGPLTVTDANLCLGRLLPE